MKKLEMGEGISNAEREEEAHGRKNTEQSKPQTKKEETIQEHAHAHTSNAQTRNTHGKRQKRYCHNGLPWMDKCKYSSMNIVYFSLVFLPFLSVSFSFSGGRVLPRAFVTFF